MFGGSGRTEVMQALFGTSNHVTGTVTMKAVKKWLFRSSKRRYWYGIVYVPEEGKNRGVVLGITDLPKYQFAAMARLVKRDKSIKKVKMALGSSILWTACKWNPLVERKGNETYAVVISKSCYRQWLATNPKVIILDEAYKRHRHWFSAAVHEFCQNWSILVFGDYGVVWICEFPSVRSYFSDEWSLIRRELCVQKRPRKSSVSCYWRNNPMLKTFI